MGKRIAANDVRDDIYLKALVESAQAEWAIRHWKGYTMHLLKYSSYLKYGIFGEFQFAGDSKPFMETLTHSYLVNGTYMPITMPGIYECKRGIWMLDSGEQIETFEITGVAEHNDLLFHWGNYNKNSKGCTLTGASRARYDSNGDGKIDAMDDEMITHSRDTFAAWMKRLDGINSFMLQII